MKILGMLWMDMVEYDVDYLFVVYIDTNYETLDFEENYNFYFTTTTCN